MVVFCDTDLQVAKLQQVRKSIPTVKHVIVFHGKSTTDGWVKTLAQLEDEGIQYAESHPHAYRNAVDAITPSHLATLIYTSGTTGKPKGVMPTYDSRS